MRNLCKQITICSLFLVLFGGLSMAQEPYFGKNKVHYQSFDWRFIQTKNFDIYYYQDQYHLAKFAADALENAYQRIKKELHYDLTKRIPVILYDSPNDFQQTNVVSDIIEENVGGFTESLKTRMVIPFTGSYEDFRHVLHHELTHAVIYDMLYGNILGSILSRQYLFQLPLWFAEGYAEYSSRGGWDIQADMVLKDATINGYLTPLDLAGGFLVYKEGQSAIGYIVEKYGEEKLAEILNKGKVELSMDKALKSAIGLDQAAFSEEWMVAQRKKYWPDIALRKEPKEFAKELTNHPKDGSYVNERPAFSPEGDRLAIFSDKSDYTEIYIISSIDGKVLKRLVKGERSGDLESLHSYVSGLSWSPDGKSLAFVSKSHGKDVLCLVSVKNGKIYKKFKFPLDAMRSPTWSPDGARIVFVGTKNGMTDLYSCEIESHKLSKLMDDYYDDEDPGFSPDGRFVVFSSDRPQNSCADSADYHFGTYDLYLLELGTWKITPAISNLSQSTVPFAGTWNNTAPTWSPDGKKICFVSDRNGIYNLYVADLESLTVTPITNILAGCFSPSWSKDGDKIAFSAFQKGGWDIYLIKEIKSAVTSGNTLSKTLYLLTLEKDTTATPVDTIKTEAPPEKLNFSSYVFKAGKSELDSLAEAMETKKTPPQADSAKYKLPNGEYREQKYKAKFSADLVSGAVGYSTFFGFQGQSMVVVSDMMGNHSFILATDVVNTIDQSNFELYYFNTAGRLNLGAGIFHTKYYYEDDINRLFSDRVYGAVGNLSYPLSMFTRAELNLNQISVDRKYYDLGPDGKYDDRSVKVLSASLSWIHDTVLWGHTGPVNGSRSLISYEYAPAFSSRNIAFGAATMDYRRYFHFMKSYDFVFRLTGGFSQGRDKKEFFLGGVTDWIGPSLGTGNIYTINDLYFASIVSPLRGYRYFDVNGTRFFLTNIELRYPFIEHLIMRFPLPMTLHYVTGAMFYDMGAAWDENKKFKGATTVGGTRLKDLKAGFGFGARVNLGFLVLRYDAGWATNLNWVAPKPRHYVSLGAEF